MANGLPPTPPPTSATEFQDEERAQEQAQAQPPEPATSSPPQSSEPSQPTQTLYQSILPTLIDLGDRKNFQELVEQAEAADLDVSCAIRVQSPHTDGQHDASQANNDRHQSRLLLTAPLVLAYLILDDLCVDLTLQIVHTALV
jgi:COP9 signalosome complex subunit 8